MPKDKSKTMRFLRLVKLFALVFTRWQMQLADSAVACSYAVTGTTYAEMSVSARRLVLAMTKLVLRFMNVEPANWSMENYAAVRVPPFVTR
jgi:hypothetical protein